MIYRGSIRERGFMKRFRNTTDAGLTPNVIPSTNLVHWFKADHAYTDSGATILCSSSGVDTCYVLKDLSGNGNDLSQSTTGQQPLWIGSAINGKPALRFDGVDDYLTNAIARTHPNTNYIVFQVIADTGNDYGIFDGGAGNECELIEDIGGNIRMYSAGYTGSTALGLTTYGLITAISNGSSSLVCLNGGSDEIGTMGATSITGATLGSSGGGGAPTNVEVAEWLSYSSVHDAGTRAGIVSILRGKYAI